MPNLRDLRLTHSMTLYEVSEATGITQAALSRLERGLTKPHPSTLAKLSDYYGISTEEIIKYVLPKRRKSGKSTPTDAVQLHENNIVPEESTAHLTADLTAMERVQMEAFKEGLLRSRKLDPAVRIPIIGETAAGFGNTAASEWTGEFVALPSDCLRGSSVSDFFALNVRGRSMEPRIMDGDIAIFRAQDDVQSGEIALVVYGDDVDAIGSYGTVKEVHKESDGALSLVALNPEFEPLTLRGEELAGVRIQGKLMQIVRMFG